MGVKKFGSESELNAQLRKLTADVRRVREELRSSLHETRRSLKRTLNGYPPLPRLRFQSDEDATC